MSNDYNCRRCGGHLKSVARAGFKRVRKCTNELCGSEFIETGLGLEYLPNEFLVGHTYRTTQYVGTVKTILDFEIVNKTLGYIDAQVNGLYTLERISFRLLKSHIGHVEVLSFDTDTTGAAFDMFPYNLINDKGSVMSEDLDSFEGIDDNNAY